jgi:hypothetical protein
MRLVHLKSAMLPWVIASLSLSVGHLTYASDWCRRVAVELRKEIDQALARGDRAGVSSALSKAGYPHAEAETMANRIVKQMERKTLRSNEATTGRGIAQSHTNGKIHFPEKTVKAPANLLRKIDSYTKSNPPVFKKLKRFVDDLTNLGVARAEKNADGLKMLKGGRCMAIRLGKAERLIYRKNTDGTITIVELLKDHDFALFERNSSRLCD